jgi:hypothetical protein
MTHAFRIRALVLLLAPGATGFGGEPSETDSACLTIKGLRRRERRGAASP